MEDKYSADEARNIKIGMAVLSIIIFVFVAISHNSSIKSKNIDKNYRIHATFGRTDGLVVGDVVRMSGVTIGRVVRASLDEDFNAKLDLDINGKYQIPDDSSASIVSNGLIGGKYIEIDVGGSEDFIPEQGTIEYTQDSMVIEDLLDRIISMGKAKRNKRNEAQTVKDIELEEGVEHE